MPPDGKLTLGQSVHVWGVHLDNASVDLDAGCALLSADERDRAARFVFERDRRGYLLAHIALHEILGRYLVIEPARIYFKLGSNGKPYLADDFAGSGLQFNLSHSGEMALVAVGSSGELGVDVECVKRDFEFLDIAKRFFTAKEVDEMICLPAELQRQAFFKCWTSKEAFLKAKGTGLSGKLDEVEIKLFGEARVQISADVPGWHLTEVSPGDDYEAALVTVDIPAAVHCYRY